MGVTIACGYISSACLITGLVISFLYRLLPRCFWLTPPMSSTKTVLHSEPALLAGGTSSPSEGVEASS